MLYLSHADTQRLDIRMTDAVPAIEEAFRRVGNGQAVVAPRVRVVHPPLEKNSMGKGRPWVRDLRIIAGAGLGNFKNLRCGETCDCNLMSEYCVTVVSYERGQSVKPC